MPEPKVSLPTRECGLKQLGSFTEEINTPSLPTRECGLKLYLMLKHLSYFLVTPHAGVWIETN